MKGCKSALGSSAASLVSASGPASKKQWCEAIWSHAFHGFPVDQIGLNWIKSCKMMWNSSVRCPACRCRQGVVQTTTATATATTTATAGNLRWVNPCNFQFPSTWTLSKTPKYCQMCNAEQASEMIKLASIETTAPNFSASKRMSVQISVYLQGTCQRIEKQGALHHGTALLRLWFACTIDLPFHVSFAKKYDKTLNFCIIQK